MSNSWQNIPEQIIGLIRRGLVRADIGNCRLVCKSWNNIANEITEHTIRYTNSLSDFTERFAVALKIKPKLDKLYIVFEEEDTCKWHHEMSLVNTWLTSNPQNRCYFCNVFITEHFIRYFPENTRFDQISFNGCIYEHIGKYLPKHFLFEELSVSTRYIPVYQVLSFNIKKLHIHVAPDTYEINLTNFHDIDISLYLIQLTCPLTIKGHTSKIKSLHFSQSVNVINLYQILLDKYINLETIIFGYFPLYKSELEVYLKLMERFMERHTLKKIIWKSYFKCEMIDNIFHKYRDILTIET